MDVEHAYRNIPTHPEDRHLLGMVWQGRLYIDTALPFGLRSAPRIFTAVADALEWALLQDGLSWSIHYTLHDFLTAGRSGMFECANNLRTTNPVLIGRLAHACKVVKPGRTFLRRMTDTAQKSWQLDHWIHLAAEF